MSKKTVIYHYTTITGLIGILTNQELWASDCRFLNDGTELSYARDIFLQEVEKLNLPPLEGGGYRIPGYSTNRFGMYITCFCENGDLLSQWRGYGADQGYSLGFSIARLKKLNVDEICPVQYGISNPRQYFERELDYAPHPTAHPGNVEWFETERLLPRLAKVKHPGFVEEKEWRLLKLMPYGSLGVPNQEIHFRSSPIGSTGFIVIPFPIKCLREIVIGPGVNAKSREDAVYAMLECIGLLSVNVRVSEIPLRM